MAFHKLPPAKHNAARVRKEAPHDVAYRGLYGMVLRSISIDHFGALEGNEIKVLMFLLNRTLRFNKIGQHLSAKAFDKPLYGRAGWKQESTFDPDLGEEGEDGSRVLYAAALNLSVNARERALKNLAAKGYLQIFQCAIQGLGISPIYEIDCKTLLGYAVKDEETDMPLREPKAKKVRNYSEDIEENTGENVVKSTNSDAPGSGECLPPKQSSYTYALELKKRASFSTGRSAPADSAITGQALVASIQARDAGKRTTRVAAAAAKAPHQIDKVEMQAMLDQVTQEYYPGRPRILVTIKAHGALRRKLKEQAPADFRDFLTFLVINWADIRSKHSWALRKRAQEGDLSALTKELPEAFDFQSIAYRLPFFLGKYTSRRMAGSSKSTEVDTSEVARLQAELARTNKELDSTRQLAARQSAQSRQREPAASIRPTRPAKGGVTGMAGRTGAPARPEPTFEVSAEDAQRHQAAADALGALLRETSRHE